MTWLYSAYNAFKHAKENGTHGYVPFYGGDIPFKPLAEPDWITAHEQNIGRDFKNIAVKQYQLVNVDFDDNNFKGVYKRKILVQSKFPNVFRFTRAAINGNKLIAYHIVAKWISPDGHGYNRAIGPAAIRLRDIKFDVSTGKCYYDVVAVLRKNNWFKYFPTDGEDVIGVDFCTDDISKIHALATYGSNYELA